MNVANNVNNVIKINYRKFLKLASTIEMYNFKAYAIRKIKYDFRNAELNKIGDEYSKEKFRQLQRIVVVQNMYSKHEDIKERKYSEH